MTLLSIRFMAACLLRTVMAGAALSVKKSAPAGRRKHGGDCGRGEDI